MATINLKFKKFEHTIPNQPKPLPIYILVINFAIYYFLIFFFKNKIKRAIISVILCIITYIIFKKYFIIHKKKFGNGNKFINAYEGEYKEILLPQGPNYIDENNFENYPSKNISSKNPLLYNFIKDSEDIIKNYTPYSKTSETKINESVNFGDTEITIDSKDDFPNFGTIDIGDNTYKYIEIEKIGETKIKIMLQKSIKSSTDINSESGQVFEVGTKVFYTPLGKKHPIHPIRKGKENKNYSRVFYNKNKNKYIVSTKIGNDDNKMVMAVMSINFDINDFKSNFHTNDILSDKVDFYLKSNIEENISEPENLDYLEKSKKGFILSYKNRTKPDNLINECFFNDDDYNIWKEESMCTENLSGHNRKNYPKKKKDKLLSVVKGKKYKQIYIDEEGIEKQYNKIQRYANILNPSHLCTHNCLREFHKEDIVNDNDTKLENYNKCIDDCEKKHYLYNPNCKDKETCPSGCSNENINNQENTIVKPAPTPTLSTTKAEYFYNKREKKTLRQKIRDRFFIKENYSECPKRREEMCKEMCDKRESELKKNKDMTSEKLSEEKDKCLTNCKEPNCEDINLKTVNVDGEKINLYNTVPTYKEKTNIKSVLNQMKEIMATWDFGGEGLSQTELGGKTQDWMLNNIFVPVFVQSGYIEYAVCHPWISILMMFSPFNIMSPLSGFILDLVLMVVDELSVNSGACECIEQVKCECGGENWIGMGKAKVKFDWIERSPECQKKLLECFKDDFEYTEKEWATEYSCQLKDNKSWPILEETDNLPKEVEDRNRKVLPEYIDGNCLKNVKYNECMDYFDGYEELKYDRNTTWQNVDVSETATFQRGGLQVDKWFEKYPMDNPYIISDCDKYDRGEDGYCTLYRKTFRGGATTSLFGNDSPNVINDYLDFSNGITYGWNRGGYDIPKIIKVFKDDNIKFSKNSDIIIDAGRENEELVQIVNIYIPGSTDLEKNINNNCKLDKQNCTFLHRELQTLENTNLIILELDKELEKKHKNLFTVVNTDGDKNPVINKGICQNLSINKSCNTEIINSTCKSLVNDNSILTCFPDIEDRGDREYTWNKNPQKHPYEPRSAPSTLQAAEGQVCYAGIFKEQTVENKNNPYALLLEKPNEYVFSGKIHKNDYKYQDEPVKTINELYTKKNEENIDCTKSLLEGGDFESCQDRFLCDGANTGCRVQEAFKKKVNYVEKNTRLSKLLYNIINPIVKIINIILKFLKIKINKRCVRKIDLKNDNKNYYYDLQCSDFSLNYCETNDKCKIEEGLEYKIDKIKTTIGVPKHPCDIDHIIEYRLGTWEYKEEEPIIDKKHSLFYIIITIILSIILIYFNFFKKRN